MFDDAIGTARRVGTEFSEKNVTFMAASIAYNAFISLVPLLIILLLAASTAGGGLEQRIIDIANTYMPGPIAGVVESVVQGEEGGTAGASAIGLVVLLWGTLKIFRGLDTAFSEIYETTGGNSFLDQIVDGLVVLVAIVFAIVATLATTTVFAQLEGTVPYIGVVTPLVLVAALILAFLPMYYRFPDVDVDLRSVLPGVVFAAVGWALFQAVFQVYLAFSGDSSGSVFGGIIVVLTWLYFSGLVLLLGAVINAVLGGHASGEAGGVGRGAMAADRENEAELSAHEVSAYLEDLRSDLTRETDASVDVVGDDDNRHHPPPAGFVTVKEQVSDEADGDEWAVVLQWKAAKESATVIDFDVESRTGPDADDH